MVKNDLVESSCTQGKSLEILRLQKQTNYTNSIIAIGAASPFLIRVLMIRV
jgi:hypothetical protein